MGRVVGAVAVIVVGLASCGASSGSEGAATTRVETQTTVRQEAPETSTTEPSTTTSTTEPAGDRGSRAEPLAVGESATIGDWEVVVTEINPNATQAILAVSEYNEPPSKGQYMLVKLKATYRGDEEGDPSGSLLVVLSGSDAVQYKEYDCSATVSTDLDFPTLEPGGSAEVAGCLDAPSEAIAGGKVFVEDQMQFDNDARAFWTY